MDNDMIRNRKMLDGYVSCILEDDYDGAALVIQQRIKEMDPSVFAECFSDLAALPKHRAFCVTINFPYPVDEQLLAPDP